MIIIITITIIGTQFSVFNILCYKGLRIYNFSFLTKYDININCNQCYNCIKLNCNVPFIDELRIYNVATVKYKITI